jgi:hypothetical protein
MCGRLCFMRQIFTLIQAAFVCLQFGRHHCRNGFLLGSALNDRQFSKGYVLHRFIYLPAVERNVTSSDYSTCCEHCCVCSCQTTITRCTVIEFYRLWSWLISTRLYIFNLTQMHACMRSWLCTACARFHQLSSEFVWFLYLMFIVLAMNSVYRTLYCCLVRHQLLILTRSRCAHIARHRYVYATFFVTRTIYWTYVAPMMAGWPYWQISNNKCYHAMSPILFTR